jgi:hypothetical protein
MLDKFAGYVLPKRLPLALLAPDGLALKKRRFEAASIKIPVR